MILELADIRIQPGRQAEFDDAIQRGLASVVTRAQGFRWTRRHSAPARRRRSPDGSPRRSPPGA
jgi:hypothetical protein